MAPMTAELGSLRKTGMGDEEDMSPSMSMTSWTAWHSG